jgi:hypothetical protein
MMKNLDVTDIEIFGLQPKNKCWHEMLKTARSFENIPSIGQFETALKWNTDKSYYHLCTVSIKDLDTDIEYIMKFENTRKVWSLELKNSKDPTDISLEDKKALFTNPDIKRIFPRAYDVLMRAHDIFESDVRVHLDSGELLHVDETRIDAIIDYIEDKNLMKNLKAGVFLK